MSNAQLDVQGLSEGGVPPQKLEKFVFLKQWIRAIWLILLGANLKQAMSEKKKVLWN